MDEVTEIYICLEGQQLSDGVLEVSHNITDKKSAEYDARQKCREDKKIFRIAYYRLNGNGDSRVFYTYTNPRLALAKHQRPIARDGNINRGNKIEMRPLTMMERIMYLFK